MLLFRILYPVSPKLIGGIVAILAATAEIFRRERNFLNMKQEFHCLNRQWNNATSRGEDDSGTGKLRQPFHQLIRNQQTPIRGVRRQT